MPEYKEKEVSGRSYQRCAQIVVDNGYGATPRMSFSEEEILRLVDGSVVVRTVPGCAVSFDPQDVIPLLNPITGESLGQSITQAQMHTFLYSAYKHVSAKRDADEAAAAGGGQ